MKRIAQFTLAIVTLTFFAGCSAILTEAEKSEVNKAPSEAVIDGHTIQLIATLTKQPTGKGNAFDLHGSIQVIAKDESFPRDFVVTGFSLKPGWKGWPGYYFANFYTHNGEWYSLGGNPYAQSDPRFSGTSTVLNGTYSIQFNWKDQGRGAGTKPEHFTAYDVSILVTDSAKKSHRLALLNVPAAEMQSH